MEWDRIASWPLAEWSRRIIGPVHRWHVQEKGSGPTILLLHGAGGSTHSYRDLIPLLSENFHVVALDLPGQGFTQLGATQRSGLPTMAEDIAALCAQEGWQPLALIGHSAGAAVALQIANAFCAAGETPPIVIGLNAALGEFPGLAGLVFPLMAKALAAMPFATTLFSSASSNPNRVRTLISSTGSQLEPEGYDLYRRLVADKAHVDGTLRMMAQWDLKPLLRALPSHEGPVHLIVGTDDATVPPTVSQKVGATMPHAEIHALEELGHLAHEEDAETVAALITQILTTQ